MKLDGSTLRPQRSLLSRVLAANVALFLSVIACLVVLFVITQHQALDHQLELRAESLCRSLSTQIEFAMLVGNTDDLNRVAQAIVRDEDVESVRITNESGGVLAYARRASSGTRAPDPSEVVAVAHEVVPRAESHLLNWQGADSAGQALGVVRVALSKRRQRALFLQTTLAAAAVAMVAALLVIVVGFLQLKRILLPLRQLIEFTRLVGKGEFGERAQVQRLDEVGDLAASFNQMVEQLEASRGELMLRVEEAQQASRLKSEFLANMSHEIRTPMNGIIGMTEIGLEMHPGPEITECLSGVRESADALMLVINDILDLSRIEAGRLTLDPADFDLHLLLRKVITTLTPQAHEKRLELLCEPGPAVPRWIAGDPVRLRQILINLTGNAIKFTERGEVVIRVAVESETASEVVLRFEVQDSGIGIPKDKQRCIFEPFVQADGSTTRKHGGTGLGLAISAQLVRMMGGELGVESRPGEGSRFYFSARLARSSEPEPALPCLPSPRIRMLVVDDHPAARRILASFGERFGLEVATAAGEAEALELLEWRHDAAPPFHLLLIDAEMPETNGFVFAERARALCPGVRVILMLYALHMADTEERRGSSGIVHRLLKPAMPFDLLASVLQALSGSPASAQPQPEPAAAAARVSGLSVLLAEDNTINQRVACRLLEKSGHRVTIADNGRKAVEACGHESFDVILMDIQMPEMDGFQATAVLRERERTTGGHTPIIAMTAHAMKGDRERCLAAGMDAYVTKPIRSAELLEVIRLQAAERVTV